jgi:PKD repeat protein
MRPNENDIFDELVRGKLTGFTEPIEPEWINRIHAKKSRVISLYQLYKMMLVILLVGAGLIASLQLVSFEEVKSQSKLHPSSTKITHPSVNTVTTSSFNYAEFAPTKKDNSTPFYVNYYNTGSALPVVKRNNSLTTKTHSYFTKKKSYSSLPKKTTQNQSHQPKIKQPSILLNNIKPDITINSTNHTQTKQDEVEACTAAFDFYTSYTGEFSFTQQLLIPNTTVVWNFGDGIISEQIQPKHTYQQSGNYEVMLTVNTPNKNCSVSKLITFQNPNDKSTPITISGKLVAGSHLVKNGLIELYQFDELKGKFKSTQYTYTNQSGIYTISINRNTRYLIKGYPSADTKNYLATYWSNTTEAENAVELLVLPSENGTLMGYTIELVLGEKQTIVEETPSVAPSAQNQQVFLVDNNNNIISIGTIDVNGKYTFTNPPTTGNYTVVNPTTKAFTSITLKGEGILNGMIDNSKQTSEGVSVFPNPAHTTVNFGVNSSVEEQAVLVIMNAGGVELVRKQIVFSIGFNQTQYDVSSFSPGVYYVMVFRGNQQVLSNRIVKLVDSDK